MTCAPSHLCSFYVEFGKGLLIGKGYKEVCEEKRGHKYNKGTLTVAPYFPVESP